MKHRRLLVTDLDGTLVGDDSALDRFVDWAKDPGRDLGLVYATGRLFPSVDNLIRQAPLPEPAAVICGVGSEIYLYPERKRLGQWNRLMDASWTDVGVRAAMAAFPELRLQEAEYQTPCKVSYYVERAPREQLDAYRRALSVDGIGHTMIYSSERDLDILPVGVSKGTAAAFLVSWWRANVGAVIVSGDSGNDRSLFEQGFRGIVVANAQAELKSLSGPLVYHSRAAYADGVLEGLRHWLGNRSGARAASPKGAGNRGSG